MSRLRIAVTARPNPAVNTDAPPAALRARRGAPVTLLVIESPRMPNLSLNPDASPAALCAVRSAPVTFVR